MSNNNNKKNDYSHDIQKRLKMNNSEKGRER